MERLEFAADLKQLISEGAQLAHGDGGEFGVARVRRVVAGERAAHDPSHDRQGLVQFSDELRDAMITAQQQARARGAAHVEAGDLLNALR